MALMLGHKWNMNACTYHSTNIPVAKAMLAPIATHDHEQAETPVSAMLLELSHFQVSQVPQHQTTKATMRSLQPATRQAVSCWCEK
jgi:hypothetical protein